MTDNNLDNLLKSLEKTFNPLKKDIKEVKNKVTSIEVQQRQISKDITSLDKRTKNMATKTDIARLEEKIDGVLDFAHKIEDERDKNAKRLTRVEAKLGIVS